MADADAYHDHVYCAECRECITCNLRPCRGGFQHITAEQKSLKEAFDDALDRVLEIENDRDISTFTQNHKDVADVEAYLTANRADLVPEEVHFLEVTIALRKAFAR